MSSKLLASQYTRRTSRPQQEYTIQQALNMTQREYEILPFYFEALMRAAFEARCEGLELRKNRELKALQDEHKKELSKRDLELIQVREERGRYRKDALAWRRKTVLTRMRQASAEENAQLATANLVTLEGVVHQLEDEREILLRCNQAMEKQLQALTRLCQGQHRAKIAQQGQLASTDAEVKQLHSQLLQSHELSELMAQQLEGEREALEGACLQIAELQQRLANERAELQAQESAHAALHAECKKLQASVSEESRARVGLEARVVHLTKELQTRNEEIAEELAQAANAWTQHNEKLSQELELRQAADAALVKNLEQNIQQLNRQLEQERQQAEDEYQRLRVKLEQDAEKELQLLRAKLESEQGLRTALEQECLDMRKQQQDDHQSHVSHLDQLSRQLSDRMVEVQQANEAARRSEEQLRLVEKRVSVNPERVHKLEAALERHAKTLCEQVDRKDAAAESLNEQLEQQRRKLENKEAELRDTQNTLTRHLEQLEQLKKRLGQREATAQEQQAQLQKQLEDACRKSECNDAQLKSQLAELQAALATRNKQIETLMDDQANQVNHQDRQLQQLEAEHAVELAKSEARIRELEQELKRLLSPPPIPRHTILANAAAAEVAVHDLLKCLGEVTEDDDDDCDFSADLLLGTSLPPLAPGPQDATMAGPSDGTVALQSPRATVTAPAPAPAAAAGATIDGRNSNTDSAADTESPAVMAERAKRPAGAAAGCDEHPVGRGCGHKVAKISEHQRGAGVSKEVTMLEAPTLALAECDKSTDAPSKMPADEGGPVKRAGSRRCAAQTGQARMKAQITALASESESETTIIDTPGFQVKGPKGRRARQRTAAQMELPSTGQSEAGVEAEIPPAAARRGRAAGGRSRAATKAAKAAETRAGEPAPSESGEVAEPLERSLAKQEKSPPLSREAASLMPPPAQPGPRKRAGKAPAGKPVDGQMDLEATQLPSDSQPQRPMLPPLRSAAFTLHDGCSITGAHFGSQPSGSQQGLPTASQASVFSQSLMQTRATHPLATMNPRMMEHVKKTLRLVPFTAVQQWKITAPSVHKNPDGQQPAAKKALPGLTQGHMAVPTSDGMTGPALPPDVLYRALQQPSNARGKKG